MIQISERRWRTIAPILVLSAASCWGIIGIFSRSLSAVGLTALQVAELRCMITAGVLILALLCTNRSYLKIRWQDMYLFLGTGIVSVVFFNICYFISIQQSTLSIACTLLYTAPCFVVLLSALLFHEQLTHKKALAIVLSFIGCACITGFIGGGDSGHITLYALLAGIGSGLGYAMYSILGRFALQKYHWLTVTTYTFLTAAVALFPFCDPVALLQVSLETTRVTETILALSLISTLLPFLLYTMGLAHMETGKASLMTFIEPVVATIISTAVFQEAFSMNNAIGIVLIALSLGILNIRLPLKKVKEIETAPIK